MQNFNIPKTNLKSIKPSRLTWKYWQIVWNRWLLITKSFSLIFTLLNYVSFIHLLSNTHPVCYIFHTLTKILTKWYQEICPSPWNVPSPEICTPCGNLPPPRNLPQRKLHPPTSWNLPPGKVRPPSVFLQYCKYFHVVFVYVLLTIICLRII